LRSEALPREYVLRARDQPKKEAGKEGPRLEAKSLTLKAQNLKPEPGFYAIL